MERPQCFCGAPMTQRRSKEFGKFWGCTRWPTCDGIIGGHPDGRPLGTPADKATRQLRIRCHSLLDGLWEPMEQEKRAYRRAAYVWLSEALELEEDEAHIASLNTAQCEQLLELLEGMGPEDLSDYLEEAYG